MVNAASIEAFEPAQGDHIGSRAHKELKQLAPDSRICAKAADTLCVRARSRVSIRRRLCPFAAVAQPIGRATSGQGLDAQSHSESEHLS